MNESQEHKMDIAVQLYNNNCDTQSEEQIDNILRALKLFISLNQSFKDRSDKILPRVLSFIALCNYKIVNFDRAYWCAKKAVELGEIAMQNSCITCNVNIYVDQQVFVILEELEKNYAEFIDFERGYINEEENIYDDSAVKEVLKEASQDQFKTEALSKNNIKTLIEVISKIQKDGAKVFDDKQALEFSLLMELFKLPLIYAWQLFEYGNRSDFIEKGGMIFRYLLFKHDIKNNIQNLLDTLLSDSPFKALETDSAITGNLVCAYTFLLNELEFRGEDIL